MDRWALHRLSELIPRVRKSYDDFEFHTIFHALNNFCSVDLSSVYLDILKDRLYTFRADSPLRRGSQTVLFEIVVAMTKLMAPVLSFTAEEIWRTLAAQPGGQSRSEQCPSERISRRSMPQWQDAAIWRSDGNGLLNYGSEVQGALEESAERRSSVPRLKRRVHYLCAAAKTAMRFLKPYERILSTLFIVSQVELVAVDNAVRIHERPC